MPVLFDRYRPAVRRPWYPRGFESYESACMVPTRFQYFLGASVHGRVASWPIEAAGLGGVGRSIWQVCTQVCSDF
jgi:hypothetical protein